MTYVEECTSSTSSWFYEYSYGNPYSDVKQQEVRVQALPPGTGSHLRVVEREGFILLIRRVLLYCISHDGSFRLFLYPVVIVNNHGHEVYCSPAMPSDFIGRSIGASELRK